MWKRIGGDIVSSDKVWEPEVEKEIQGKYVGKKEAKGKMQSNMYVLSVKDENVGIWGSTVLDTKFGQIEVGDDVKVVYKGEVMGKAGRTYKDFDVFVDDPTIQEEDLSSEDLPF